MKFLQNISEIIGLKLCSIAVLRVLFDLDIEKFIQPSFAFPILCRDF